MTTYQKKFQTEMINCLQITANQQQLLIDEIITCRGTIRIFSFLKVLPSQKML